MTGSRRPPLPPGPYLVVGLARSGAAAMRMLRSRGEVLGLDSGDPPQAAALRDEGFEVHLRTPGVDLLERAGTVVKSPGVPRTAPVVLKAAERGIAAIGELELAWRLLPNEFVAVTGTNGKTTTAELLGAIHRAAGEPVAVAGNVGTPLATLVGELPPTTTVVCEASSFQLEDSEAFAPEAAVLLNLREDHLDRHGTVEAYRAAKLRAFANQGPDDVAVAPLELVRGGDLPGQARRVSFGPPGSDVEEAGGMLSWRGEALLPVSGIRLRGAHNHENAMAAAAAALARGIGGDAVRDALRTFAGVPHRLEEVAERGGVLYVNDSKATNVDSATVGIRAFERGVHAILGGSLKGGGFQALREPVAERCVACYLIGEASRDLTRDLDGTVPLHPVGDLERAVRTAAAAARPGQVVLLSPACASYDQYRDFEERGEHFRRLVRELASGE
ncbi:MAG: UDP-N-acetylmuramoyl-L-alanine--D-glutamate ligase [Actinobacteria bacterium]|nr:MAG: UDP-N-acetylmuramoyl-L-alanine--D-glutamate ligase [Actinomycetota bacterium]